MNAFEPLAASAATGRAAPVVWVTGASSGIGEALARRYVVDGAYVILTARRVSRLESLRDSLPDPSRVFLLPGDPEDPAIHERLTHSALAWRGHVDLVIHSAGVSQRGSVAETTLPTVRRIMEINFFAVVGLTRALLPSMLARGKGTVVVIGSVVSYVATPQRSAYAAAKHAIRAWADALRGEVGGTGIQVTTVIAGYVATGISAAALLADGSAKGVVEATDAQGLSRQSAADKIFAGVKAGKREIILGGNETWSVWLQRHFPWVVAWLLPRFAPR